MFEADEAFAYVYQDFHRLAVVNISRIKFLGISAASEDEGGRFGLGGSLATGKQDAKGKGQPG